MHKTKPYIEDFVSSFMSSVDVNVASFEIKKMFPHSGCAKTPHGALKLSKYGLASYIEKLKVWVVLLLNEGRKTWRLIRLSKID